MAKCLRCSAGNEWIQGRVKNEPDPEKEKLIECLAEAYRLLYREGVDIPNKFLELLNELTGKTLNEILREKT